MRTMNKYGIEFAGPRRRGCAWRRYLGCALWMIMGLVMLAWVMWAMWHAEDTTRGVPMLRGGFPDWVAFGIVGTLVMGLLGRLAWGAMKEAFQIQELAEPPEHDAMEAGGNAIPPSDERWMEELRALMRQRNTVISDKVCRQIRALCVPRHRMDIVMLDAFLRREMGLRLFVTTLKEIQSICGKAGKEGAWS